MVELPLSLADASHEFQIDVSLRILTIKINQWARVNFCSYRKNGIKLSIPQALIAFWETRDGVTGRALAPHLCGYGVGRKKLFWVCFWFSHLCFEVYSMFSGVLLHKTMQHSKLYLKISLLISLNDFRRKVHLSVLCVNEKFHIYISLYTVL